MAKKQLFDNLSNAQRELLNLFQLNLPESELKNLKKVLLKFKADVVTRMADKIWDEKGWTNETMEEFLNTHMRTPYLAQQEFLERRKNGRAAARELRKKVNQAIQEKGITNEDLDNWAQEQRPNGIEKTEGVCGGSACIRGARIPVWVIVAFWKLGETPQEMLKNYPSLKPADLQNALNYYSENTEEIEKEIKENDEI